METKPEYYNEFNPDAAAWLRDLIKARELPEGDVDERSIADLRPEDLKRYHRCHFFAGIGLWPYALRLAGFPADEPVWTGSCPCQPFSSAGKQKGEEDPRHLWPVWNRLIEECKPPTVFGEQVAAAIGKGWLDLVQSDLERKGYAVGKAVLSAASVGAPHIRQRLYFVADTKHSGREREQIKRRGSLLNPLDGSEGAQFPISTHGSSLFKLAYAKGTEFKGSESEEGWIMGRSKSISLANPEGSNRGLSVRSNPQHQVSESERGSEISDTSLGDTFFSGLERHRGFVNQYDSSGRQGEERYQPTQGFWGDCGWVWCRDSKFRPIEPFTFPLAHGLPLNMGSMPPELQRLAELAGLSGASLKRAKNFRKTSLQGYGNAIVPQVAVEFISAYLETRTSE